MEFDIWVKVLFGFSLVSGVGFFSEIFGRVGVEGEGFGLGY